MTDSNKSSLLISRRRLLHIGVGTVFHLGFTAPLWAAEKQVSVKKIPPSKPRPPRFVMIDPGHGGKDPGAIGRKGTLEKDITLDVSQRIATELQRHRHISTGLTRKKDEFLPLNERVTRSREAKADFFISIHADSAPDKAARGLSAYSLSDKGTDDFARELAKRENSVDGIGGVNLHDTEPDVAAILMDLTARHTRNAALKAKRHIVRGVGKEWRLLDNPMRAAGFAVLRAPDVPSILIETGFLSSPKDEALLANAKQRQRIASLIAREIASLLKTAPFA